MLNNLKEKIETCGCNSYKNIEIIYDELIISANKYTGYLLIRDLVTISEIIDTDIYNVEYLNDNIIKVKVK